MTITTTSNPLAFDVRLYQGLSSRVAKKLIEDVDISFIPSEVAPLDAPEFKKPIYGASQGVHGGVAYTTANKMETAKSHKVFTLGTVQADLFYNLEDMMLEGPYLEQKKAAELSEWEWNIKMGIWKGVYEGSHIHAAPATAMTTPLGTAINEGILNTTYNATSVTNLDGTNSALVAAGDVYKALTKMLNAIPFSIRQGGVPVKFGCTSNFILKANSALFTYTSGKTELQQFLEEYSGPNASPGYAVDPKFIISDDIFLASGDTQGTHDRLFSCVPREDVMGKAFSRGISMLGEARNSIGGVTQSWASKLAGCVYQRNGVNYSDQITW